MDVDRSHSGKRKSNITRKKSKQVKSHVASDETILSKPRGSIFDHVLPERNRSGTGGCGKRGGRNAGQKSKCKQQPCMTDRQSRCRHISLGYISRRRVSGQRKRHHRHSHTSCTKLLSSWELSSFALSILPFCVEHRPGGVDDEGVDPPTTTSDITAPQSPG